MDRDAARSEVSQRNALRRAACLPLLDLEAETLKLLRRERLRAWAEVMERHRDERDRLLAAAVVDHKQKSGSVPLSGFAWMGLHHRVHEQFAAHLRGLGYKPL